MSPLPLQPANSSEPQLGRAEAPAPLTGAQRRAALECQARRLVALVFFQPLLEGLTQGPFAGGPLSPGPQARGFQTLLNQQLADRMSRAAAGRKIADSVVRRWESQRAEPDAPLRLDDLHRPRTPQPRADSPALDVKG